MGGAGDRAVNTGKLAAAFGFGVPDFRWGIVVTHICLREIVDGCQSWIKRYWRLLALTQAISRAAKKNLVLSQIKFEYADCDYTNTLSKQQQ